MKFESRLTSSLVCDGKVVTGVQLDQGPTYTDTAPCLSCNGSTNGEISLRDPPHSVLGEQRLFCNLGGQCAPSLIGGTTTLLILVLTQDCPEHLLHPCHDPSMQSSEHLTAHSLECDGVGA